MLLLFNPDTDMALGEFTPNYIAPAAIRKMADDLAGIAYWMGGEADYVVVDTPAYADYTARMQQLFGAATLPAPQPNLKEALKAGMSSVLPWGWNPTLVRRLTREGANPASLPHPDALFHLRQCASRAMLPALDAALRKSGLPFVDGEHHCLHHPDELEALSRLPSLRTHGFVLKTCWSGSGRGLRWCRNGLTEEAVQWAAKCLQRQGVLLAEPIYNKVEDFAMEFESNGHGTIRFCGYSRFLTTPSGAWQANLLESDEAMEAHLSHNLPPQSLPRLRHLIPSLLAPLYGRYQGPLGVDMMMGCTDSGRHFVHASVEVNLRHTMGWLARRFHDRRMTPGSHGVLKVESSASCESLWQRHLADAAAHPLDCEEGRLCHGYLPLSPVLPTNRYRAYVLVD